MIRVKTHKILPGTDHDAAPEPTNTHVAEERAHAHGGASAGTQSLRENATSSKGVELAECWQYAVRYMTHLVVRGYPLPSIITYRSLLSRSVHPSC